MSIPPTIATVVKNTTTSSAASSGIMPHLTATSRMLLNAATGMALCSIFFTHIASFANTQGDSMYPTLTSGSNYLLIQKYQAQNMLKSGDIVILKSPVDPEILLVKRIIGLPGQTIPVPNDITQHPPEILSFLPTIKSLTIPTGHLWVEGDNQDYSIDSRHFGAIPQALVVGIARAKVDLGDDNNSNNNNNNNNNHQQDQNYLQKLINQLSSVSISRITLPPLWNAQTRRIVVPHQEFYTARQSKAFQNNDQIQQNTQNSSGTDNTDSTPSFTQSLFKKTSIRPNDNHNSFNNTNNDANTNQHDPTHTLRPAQQATHRSGPVFTNTITNNSFVIDDNGKRHSIENGNDSINNTSLQPNSNGIQQDTNIISITNTTGQHHDKYSFFGDKFGDNDGTAQSSTSFNDNDMTEDDLDTFHHTNKSPAVDQASSIKNDNLNTNNQPNTRSPLSTQQLTQPQHLSLQDIQTKERLDQIHHKRVETLYYNDNTNIDNKEDKSVQNSTTGSSDRESTVDKTQFYQKNQLFSTKINKYLTSYNRVYNPQTRSVYDDIDDKIRHDNIMMGSGLNHGNTNKIGAKYISPTQFYHTNSTTVSSTNNKTVTATNSDNSTKNTSNNTIHTTNDDDNDDGMIRMTRAQQLDTLLPNITPEQRAMLLSDNDPSYNENNSNDNQLLSFKWTDIVTSDVNNDKTLVETNHENTMLPLKPQIGDIRNKINPYLDVYPHDNERVVVPNVYYSSIEYNLQQSQQPNGNGQVTYQHKRRDID